METVNTEGLISCQCEADDKAVDEQTSEHEKPGESYTASSVAQADLQGHKAIPDPGETELMETEVPGTVEKDSAGHEVASARCSAEITPDPNEVMEACMSEQKKDQHPETSIGTHEKDSDQVHRLRSAELSPKRDEELEMKVTEQNEDQRSDSEKRDVEKDTVSPLFGGGGSLALLSTQYRDENSDDLSESESDSSSSTSSSSSSSSSSPIITVPNDIGQDEDEDGVASWKKSAPVRTQDEVLIEELPAVENLTISLPEGTNMEPIGIISSIVDLLVIVESYKDTPPLNDDSILFSKDRVSIGKVFEVFGPVCQPYYILRFNSQEDIKQRGLKIKELVYFAPRIKDFTEYIFVEQIKRTRGSDASWKNDQEPPPEALDFSDDEKEKMAKQKLKAQRRPQQQKQEESDSADSESSASRPPPPPPPHRRKPRQNRNSPHGQPVQHEHQGGFHANYHANPHFQQNFLHRPHDPFRPPFRGQGYPPFPQAPPPHMGIGPWHLCPYPGPMFYPPPPPPPPPPPSN